MWAVRYEGKLLMDEDPFRLLDIACKTLVDMREVKASPFQLEDLRETQFSLQYARSTDFADWLCGNATAANLGVDVWKLREPKENSEHLQYRKVSLLWEEFVKEKWGKLYDHKDQETPEPGGGHSPES